MDAKRFALSLLALIVLLALYVLAWPTGMTPVSWTPPAAPPLEGRYAYNEKLKGIQRIGLDVGVGPEGVFVDAAGRIYAGYRDGRVVQFLAEGAEYVEWPETDGRPLGITSGPKGGIVVADADEGLLHLGNKARLLTKEAEGQPFGLTDDADSTASDQKIYFTDASSKFGLGSHMKDALEHGANGRLLVHDMATKETRVLLRDLHFPNGVAVGPDDAYVLVNETTEYRILRYWLKGERKGTHEVFIDNLPGFPDNISYNGRDRFWVALFAPRDAYLDQLLPGKLFLRQVLARLPSAFHPKPKKHSFVLGLATNSTVVANLQYAGDDAYAPITSVREHGPWLYFGSLSQPAIGRLPLNQALPAAPPPPAGWERVPEAKPRPQSSSEEEEEEREREEAEEEEEKRRQQGR